MPVGCFTGPTTLDFMKFNISRPRNYGLMDFTTESTESWMCSNGIYIYISLALQDITDKGNVIKFVENISLE